MPVLKCVLWASLLLLSTEYWGPPVDVTWLQLAGSHCYRKNTIVAIGDDFPLVLGLGFSVGCI